MQGGQGGLLGGGGVAAGLERSEGGKHVVVWGKSISGRAITGAEAWR